jgi:hypothetical protein
MDKKFSLDKCIDYFSISESLLKELSTKPSKDNHTNSNMGSFMEPSTRPQYHGSYDELTEVLQREFGITNGDDSKPILATYGLGPCVSMIGWSPKHKVGFLTHYDSMTKLSDSFSTLFYRISQQLEKKASEFDVRIVGGETNQSEQIIDFLKSRLNMRKDIKMRLIEEDTGGCMNPRSIALDTRTGETFSYNPNLNPYMRKITELDIMKLRIESPAKLVYVPKRV